MGFRIALACSPFPHSLDEGLLHLEQAAREAAAQGARVLCFPETYLPGYPLPDEKVAPVSAAALARAEERAQSIARNHRIALIVPMDRSEDRGLLNVATVISADGAVQGYQAKVQLDPTEDSRWVPGLGRRLFEIEGVKIGVVICHEGFRYPETVRWAAREGAQVVFHPHAAGSDQGGRVLQDWRAPSNPYYEQAMMCRALENTIYFASVNYAFRYPESASAVFAPDGRAVAVQPYGQAGVLVADLELARATRLLALRWRACE